MNDKDMDINLLDGLLDDVSEEIINDPDDFNDDNKGV